MNIPGITWKGECIEDLDILRDLPEELAGILKDVNGFILYGGAIHVRGASIVPAWHSLRASWRGPQAFHILYESVSDSDIPFAQDQFGDQFLIRRGKVIRLSAETGEIEPVTESVEDFFAKLSDDIEIFLNVGLSHTLQPGELLLAYPPFVAQEAAGGSSLKAVPAGEVILFHAELARQIQDVPDGGQIEFKITR